MNRREFLKRIAGVITGVGLLGTDAVKVAYGSGTDTPPPSSAKSSVRKNSEVIMLDCKKARLAPDKFNKELLKQKLDRALMRLTNTDVPAKAWKSLFSPKDVVGLKLNCLAGKGLSSTPELVYAVVDGLLQAGVPERNIIIWERFNRELIRAGFKINRSGKGVRCYGTERNYESEPTSLGSVGSCLSRIFVRSTALVNIGVVKDHNLAGASIGMKNLFGIIHNPNKYHFNNCDPYVADLSASRPVRQRMRLIIADALWAQYHNGPARDDHYRWAADTVLVGLDPVSIDAVGIDIIEKKRKSAGLKSLAEEGRPPRWLQTANKLHLGESDLSKIQITKI
ncbi:DUF362 domain-containing protein [Candidatus Sumerlaeota bacterium]|nr:DUF362 domain-containing protein [Candidatus Sumerlaeota bacterium]